MPGGGVMSTSAARQQTVDGRQSRRESPGSMVKRATSTGLSTNGSNGLSIVLTVARRERRAGGDQHLECPSSATPCKAPVLELVEGSGILFVGPPKRRGVVTSQLPLVDYLVLGDEPHLVAHECSACGARFFDRRNACAACGATDVHRRRRGDHGELRSFTIVSFAAPGVPVPFVAGLVDCEGTTVRGNVINVEPDPEHVKLGMKVKLATQPMGVDQQGVEAIAFGFEPV